MAPDHDYAVTNPHNAPATDPRRGCDACGLVRAAHRPYAQPHVRRIETGGWVWCSSRRQTEPAIASPEWIEYVPPTACPHCGARVVGKVPACGDGCPRRASLLEIVADAASRFDKRCILRASVDTRRELRCNVVDPRRELHCCPEHRCGWCAECRDLPM